MKLHTIKERFKGPVLFDALKRQELVACEAKAARRIASVCKIVEIAAGSEFIRDGDTTSDVFLILQGLADISIKGSIVATRAEGQHVGEMAVLLNSRRTASVFARTEIVAAKISRERFLELGRKYPSLWAGVARTLAIRLDQRRNLVREPNLRPQVFIASASESKSVAYALKAALDDKRWDIEVWDEAQVFPASTTFIAALCKKAQQSDFGIAVFGRDDKVTSRKKNFDSARDNVILEGGMFIGSAGLERTYFLIPDGKNFKKPTDLDGVVMLPYKRSIRTIDVHGAASKIRTRLEALGVR